MHRIQNLDTVHERGFVKLVSESITLGLPRCICVFGDKCTIYLVVGVNLIIFENLIPKITSSLIVVVLLTALLFSLVPYFSLSNMNKTL